LLDAKVPTFLPWYAPLSTVYLYVHLSIPYGLVTQHFKKSVCKWGPKTTFVMASEVSSGPF